MATIFTDDHFQIPFLKWKSYFIHILLKFVPNCQINNNPSVVQIMSCRRAGDKPSSEPFMVSLLTYKFVIRPQCVKYERVSKDLTELLQSESYISRAEIIGQSSDNDPQWMTIFRQASRMINSSTDFFEKTNKQ